VNIRDRKWRDEVENYIEDICNFWGGGQISKLLGKKVKEDVMDRMCSMYSEDEKRVQRVGWQT